MSASQESSSEERSENLELEEEGSNAAEEDPSYEDEEQVLVMDEANQTDGQRRLIRSQQRQLLEQLGEVKASATSTDAIREIRSANNRIFIKKVRHTREAVLDGQVVETIATKTVENLEKQMEAPRYDAHRLVMKLRQKCRSQEIRGGSSFFDWRTLGREASVCFNALPSHVNFFHGPLTDGAELQVRQRQRRERNVDDLKDIKEERPKELGKEGEAAGEDERPADRLTAVERSMAVMFKRLEKKSSRNYMEKKERVHEHLGVEQVEDAHPAKKKLRKFGPDVDMIQFLVNPHSFTQTVENFFHFAFLIKHSQAGVVVRRPGDEDEDGDGVDAILKDMPGPVAKFLARGLEQASNRPDKLRAPKQCIVTLTMKDWRDLCRVYEIKEGQLPHRTGSKVTSRLSTEALSQQFD